MINLIKTVFVFLIFIIPGINKAQEFNPPFFVFEDGLWNAESDAPEYWTKLVRDVGFDGVELIGLDRLEGMIPELRSRDLRLFTLYIAIEIDKDQPYDPRLKTYIKRLENTGLHLWVHVRSEKYPPSDPGGDERCVEIISELADFAREYGVKIAFYPHSNFWVEKIGDGVRLAQKIDRPNVGTVFNLCHFLKKDETDKLEQKIEEAMPHLFLVSINGADEGNTHEMGWDRLIQPLGEGDYDVINVLQILKDKGYKNPIGLQCYNIEGKPEEFLRKSMATWKEYYNTFNKYHLTYRYEDGLELDVHGDSIEIFIEGTNGWLLVKGWNQPLQASDPELLKLDFSLEEIQLYTAENEQVNFIDCIKSRKEPYHPAEDMHRTATIAHMGHIAMLLERKLKWDPAREEFIKDEEANRMRSREERDPWKLDDLLA
jgi:sugar phosphate isomerase/epimerase